MRVRLLLLALLLPPSLAGADPVALRLPGGSAAEVVVAAGWPQQSAGVWFTPNFGMAMELRLPLGTVGGSLGGRQTVARGRKGWGLEVFGAGGVSTTLADHSIAMAATAAVQGGVLSKRGLLFSVGIAMPAVLRMGRGPHPVQGKLPFLLEVHGGVDAGPLWLGVTASGGVVFSTDAGLSNAFGVAAWLRIPLPRFGGPQKTTPSWALGRT
ncbi:MAG: hypothetical protein KDA24_03150 [Deltaproteobacteria bacterium]|nr:hypothetical protein [Deltaproteobacteria bacterium]